MTTRDAILSAVNRPFAREGYGLVGVDALAAQAGVTKRTLYKHFGSKAGLFEAWLERRDAATRRALFAAVETRADTPRGEVMAVFEVLAMLAHDPGFHGCPFSRALVELGEAQSASRAVAIRHKAALCDWFAERLRAAGLDEVDARAEELVVLYEGVLQRTATARSPAAAAAAGRLAALRWP